MRITKSCPMMGQYMVKYSIPKVYGQMQIPLKRVATNCEKYWKIGYFSVFGGRLPCP